MYLINCRCELHQMEHLRCSLPQCWLGLSMWNFSGTKERVFNNIENAKPMKRLFEFVQDRRFCTRLPMKGHVYNWRSLFWFFPNQCRISVLEYHLSRTIITLDWVCINNKLNHHIYYSTSGSDSVSAQQSPSYSNKLILTEKHLQYPWMETLAKYIIYSIFVHITVSCRGILYNFRWELFLDLSKPWSTLNQRALGCTRNVTETHGYFNCVRQIV